MATAPMQSPSPTGAANSGAKLRWSTPVRLPNQASFHGSTLGNVSCPSTTFCVFLDDHGNAVSSTTPLAGATGWTVTNIHVSVGPNSSGPWLTGLSCPSISLCVAVDNDGNVITSADPTGGPSKWRTSRVDGDMYLTGVSCPSTTLCVAVDTFGNVVTSTNPGGGATAWAVTGKARHASTPYGQNGFSTVSCATNSLCFAGDYLGNVLASSNPTGGLAAWTRVRATGSTCTISETGALCEITALSCVIGVCVAGDFGGNLLTSVTPTAGARAWKTTPINTNSNTSLGGISCATSGMCVVIKGDGKLLSSSNPNGGASAWKAVAVDGSYALTGVSCPTSTFCIAVDTNGSTVTSTQPLAGVGTAWKVAFVDGSNALVDVSCPGPALCIAIDGGDNVLTSTNPAAGNSAWAITSLGGSITLSDLSCPTDHLCVATGWAPEGDGAGRALIVTSQNPTGGKSAWTVTTADSWPSHMSCASANLCAAIGEGDGGYSTIVTSSAPTAGAEAWTITTLDGDFILLDMSCPTTIFCVAVDNSGHALISTNPTGGAATWKATQVDNTPNFDNTLEAVSCSASLVCTAVSFAGNVVTSTNPTGGPTAWKVTHVSTTYLAKVSCFGSATCVVVDEEGNIFDSRNPTGGKAAWTETSIDRGSRGFSGVSCPSSDLCIAVDNSGNVVVGSRPTPA